MKKIFLFLALSIIALSCSGDDTAPSQTFTLIGEWTELAPTTGRHKVNFINATQMSLRDDSAEGIIYDYTYTLENDILTVTSPDGTTTTHPFEIVSASKIKITSFGFYAQPACANCPPIVVTFVKD